MKNPLNWKAVGQFLALFVELCTLVRNTFTELKVGIEILEWVLSDEGRKYFVTQCLHPLGDQFLKTQRIKVLDKNTVLINLGASPKLPFEGATVEWHYGEGLVQMQKRKDGLYVGDKKVVLTFSERQQNGKTIQGHELREELTGKPVLNANIMDTLLAHPHLIPEDWKKDANGNTIYIFFWATGYRLGGLLCVRFFFWVGGKWYSLYGNLDFRWGASSPAASLTS